VSDERFANDPPTQHPRVRGRCPSCGAESLFLGSQGYVTCSVLGCKDPGAPSDLLAGPDGRRALDPDLVRRITEAVLKADTTAQADAAVMVLLGRAPDCRVTFEKDDEGDIIARFHGVEHWHLAAHGKTHGEALTRLAEIVRLAEGSEPEKGRAPDPICPWCGKPVAQGVPFVKSHWPCNPAAAPPERREP